MLGVLDKFRKKKKEEKVEVKSTKTIITELEQICGDDKETYEGLLNTMFLDPTKIGISMKEATENAKKSEKEKNLLKARIWYEIAGGLAIYEGNVKKVEEFFSECRKLSSDRKYQILKNPENALSKAQEFYKKYLKI